MSASEERTDGDEQKTTPLGPRLVLMFALMAALFIAIKALVAVQTGDNVQDNLNICIYMCFGAAGVVPLKLLLDRIPLLRGAK